MKLYTLFVLNTRHVIVKKCYKYLYKIIKMKKKITTISLQIMTYLTVTQSQFQ
jgi:hypothetical protein